MLPVNGTVHVTGTVYGSVATYNCSVGYTQQGNATVLCLATGQWSGPPPVCSSELSSQTVRQSAFKLHAVAEAPLCNMPVTATVSDLSYYFPTVLMQWSTVVALSLLTMEMQHLAALHMEPLFCTLVKKATTCKAVTPLTVGLMAGGQSQRRVVFVSTCTW